MYLVFFKQNTAYEMRISDWSSDVCSSDLDLSNTASDIVGGLRVLRGVGGEAVFLDRYRRESQGTRRAGVRVAKLQSVLDALQVLLPGVFVVIVVWLGAR